MTLNVSRTGLLLRGAHALPAEGDVDLVLALPRCDAFPGARVRCTAAVIRMDEGGLAALEIRRYRFLKPGDADEDAVGEWADVE